MNILMYVYRFQFLNLLKCIHSIFIDVYKNKEYVRGVLLGVTPRVGQNSEFIKRIPEGQNQVNTEFIFSHVLT